MVASVPELTMRTISMEGIISQIRSAMVVSTAVGVPKERPASRRSRTAPSTSGSAWPVIIGPQEPT